MHYKVFDGIVYRYYSRGERLPVSYQVGNDSIGWENQVLHPLTCLYVPYFTWGKEYRAAIATDCGMNPLCPSKCPEGQVTTINDKPQPAKTPKKHPPIGSVCINSFGRVGVLTSVDDDNYYGFGLDGKGIWQSRKPKMLSRSLERYRKRVLAAGGTGGFMYASPVSND